MNVVQKSVKRSGSLYFKDGVCTKDSVREMPAYTVFEFSAKDVAETWNLLASKIAKVADKLQDIAPKPLADFDSMSAETLADLINGFLTEKASADAVQAAGMVRKTTAGTPRRTVTSVEIEL